MERRNVMKYVADGTARHFLRKSLERAIFEIIVEVRQTSSVLFNRLSVRRCFDSYLIGVSPDSAPN